MAWRGAPDLGDAIDAAPIPMQMPRRVAGFLSATERAGASSSDFVVIAAAVDVVR